MTPHERIFWFSPHEILCFCVKALAFTGFFAYLNSSHGVLSMIYGFLRKYRLVAIATLSHKNFHIITLERSNQTVLWISLVGGSVGIRSQLLYMTPTHKLWVTPLPHSLVAPISSHGILSITYGILRAPRIYTEASPNFNRSNGCRKDNFWWIFEHFQGFSLFFAWCHQNQKMCTIKKNRCYIYNWISKNPISKSQK